jgi:hypothetical protein
MAYGGIKVDNITFTNDGADQATTVSGLYRAITSGVTVTGTLSGNIIQGVTVSGITVTGTTAQFTNITGGGIGATTITGTTVTGTTANFVSGVFTTQLSGVTVTGTQSSFTSGNFVTLSGTTATFTSGIIASGTAAAPSLSIVLDPNTGIYSPGADQVAISTGGTGRLFVDASGNLSLGTGSAASARLFVSGGALTTAAVAGFALSGGLSTGRLTSDSGNINSIHTFLDNSTIEIAPGSTYKNGISINGLGTASDSNTVKFFTSNSERLRIDSLGRVGIGTTTPGTSRAYIQTDDTNTAGLTINGIGSSGGVSSYSSLKITGGSPNAVGTHYGVEFIKTPSNVESITGYYANITGTYNTQTNFHAKLTKDLNAFTNGYCYYADLATSGSGGTAYFAYFYNSTSSAERFSITSAGTTTLTSAASTAPFIAKIGSSEVSRIDSSGRLLVGTSAARSNFFNASFATDVQIERSGDCSLSLVRNSATQDSPYLIFGKTRGTSVGANNAVLDNDDLGYIVFQGSDGSELVSGAAILAEVDGTPGANDMPGRLVFSTTADGAATPTERMRITQKGDLLLNATAVAGVAVAKSYMYLSGGANVNTSTYATQNCTLHVRFEANSNNEGASNALVLQLENMAGTTKPQLLRGYNSSDGLVLNADYRGALTNFGNSYGAISDSKFKTDIIDATSAWEDIKAVRVRKYKIKTEVQELGSNAESYLGVVAQEIESFSPGLVVTPADYSDTNEENKSVKYSVLYMKAVKALQEAMERIEQLEAAVADLQQP